MGKRSCYCISRHQRSYVAMVHHNMKRNELIQCNSMFLRSLSRKIWNDIESQLLEKLATEILKRENKSMHGELKMWKEWISTNFYGQDVLHVGIVM